MIAAALFDLDGVLRQHDPNHATATEEAARLPAGALHQAAFEVGRLAAAVGGRWTFEQWRDAVADHLADRYRIDGRDTADRFFAIEAARVDEAVLAVVREVRARVPVGLLTNASSRLPAELDALGLTAEVDVVCNSWELGVAKPAPEAFALAAERMGCEATACFFTDDRAENAEAARRAGMRAHHFTGIDGLRHALREVLEG
jgi:putative hydrolase of the HAD superfamily